MRGIRWATPLALVLAVLLAARGKAAETPRLGEPGYLSATARRALHVKMRSHVTDMQSLLDDVLLLRRERIRADARRIADEPQIARPSGAAADELNASLPERYFALQDALQQRARALEHAAQAQSERRIAQAFSDLTQVCVECHATYLGGRTAD